MANGTIRLVVSGYHTEPDREYATREFKHKLAKFEPLQIIYNGNANDRRAVSSSHVPPERARDFAAAVKKVIGENPVTLTFVF